MADDDDLFDRTFGSALDISRVDPASESSMERAVSTQDRARLDDIDRIVGARRLPVETISARLGDDGGALERLPDAVPDYEIADRLGRGGMGEVFEVHQTSLERNVALKVFRPRAEGDDTPDVMRQFAREAVLTARLEHPNVVPVHALAKDPEGNLFFTMKKIDGVEWRRLLHPRTVRDPDARVAMARRAETMGWRDHVGILLKVMDAVAYAHAKGVLHRDLKPSNVMIGDFGEVYVMDWGLATAFGPDSDLEDVEQKGGDLKLAGTPRYMAPEMVRGELTRLGEHTDVYLLGGVLFEIATGRMPRHGKDLRASLMMALSGRIEDPAQVEDPVHLTSALRKIIIKAMAPRIEERYPTVQALRADLENYLAHAEAINLAATARTDLRELAEELRPGGQPMVQRKPEAVAEPYARIADIIARLRQALDAHPRHGPARAGLHDAGILAAELALAQEDLALAEVRIRELDRIPGDGTDETFREKVHDDARRLRLKVAERRRHRVLMAARTKTLRIIAIVLTVVAAAGLAFGAFMLDSRRQEAVDRKVSMFRVAVEGRADMIGQFIGDVERIADLYRRRAVELMAVGPPVEPVTPAGRPGFYLDADFYDPATAPPGLQPLDGYNGPMSLDHPTVVRAPWVREPMRITAADADAARLAQLGPLFGKVHRVWGRDLKWSLAGSRTGLLVGFPGSGRYEGKPDYDPTKRPWYKAAIDAIDDTPVWGEPYVDASTGQVIISCIGRIRVEDETVGVVGVEVTLETVQRILLDFARSGGSDIRALLVRPFRVKTAEGARDEYRVVIDTRSRTQSDDWQEELGMPLVSEVDADVAAYVQALTENPKLAPERTGSRIISHARLEGQDWLLVVTALMPD